MSRKVATVSHEAGGIRINIDNIVAHFGNVVYLGEAHAQLMITSEDQQKQLTGIRSLVNHAEKGNDQESTAILRGLIADIRKFLDEGVPF